MDVCEAKAIVDRYVNAWNGTKRDPMWVSLAMPGDPINIPDVTFGNQDFSHAGMELSVRAQLIVLNRAMRAESLLSTFLHEYGHALYRAATPGTIDPIESEVWAIRHSLQALESEGFEELAFQEAAAVKQMATAEPYRSAVAKLGSDPHWQKYALRGTGG